MRTTTIVTGLLCIVLGVGLSIAATRHGSSWATAAIPAYVGILFVLLGALATSVRARMITMHIAALLALVLAFGGIGMGLPKLLKYHNGTLPPNVAARPLAWWGQCTLGIIMIAYLVLAVRSFIAARRWRKANETTPAVSSAV